MKSEKRIKNEFNQKLSKQELSFDEMICPECGRIAIANFVDIGVGFTPVEPFHCSCGWVEGGCPADDCEKCISFKYCQGKSKEEQAP